MSKFRVTFTQCNTYTYEVDASSKADAKHKAYDRFLDNLRYFKPDAEYDKVEVEEISTSRRIDANQLVAEIASQYLNDNRSSVNAGKIIDMVNTMTCEGCVYFDAAVAPCANCIRSTLSEDFYCSSKTSTINDAGGTNNAEID